MAFYDLEEQEKIAALKQWWDRYGKYVSAVLTIVAVALVGWQAWQYYQREQAKQASILYTSVSQGIQKKEAAKVKDALEQLQNKYPSTAYTPRAALLVAKMAFDENDKATAKNHLQWVIDRAREDELKQLARWRLAQILLDEKQYDEALKILDSKHDESLTALYADLRGDILLSAGKPAEAKAAYEAALAKFEAKSQYRNYVQMKLDSLGDVQ